MKDWRIVLHFLTRIITGSGPVSDRQDHSYPHEAIDSPDGRFVFVPDLGADQIHSFSLTSPTTCGLTQLPSIKTDAGDGPRHMKFYSKINNQTYAYVVTELSGVIRSYLVEDDGNLKLLKVQSARPSGLTKAEASKVAPSEVSSIGPFLIRAFQVRSNFFHPTSLFPLAILLGDHLTRW